MDEAPIEGASAEAGPADVGDTGSEAQPEGGSEEAPRQYVEIDDPDNRYARVRVDGEDVEVPYGELVKGYSREADYTRKTQALAQQRQEAEYGIRLQQALQANPQLTLQILAQQFAAEQEAPDYEMPEQEYDDPLEREIALERQARLALEDRIAQREADEVLERAVGGLRQQFNLNDEDVRTVVGAAYNLGLGVEALPMIHKAMLFDRLQASVQARRAAQQQRNAETQKRQSAAASATQLIASTTNGGNGLTNQVAADGRMTIREAIEAAYEQAERGG